MLHPLFVVMEIAHFISTLVVVTHYYGDTETTHYRWQHIMVLFGIDIETVSSQC